MAQHSDTDRQSADAARPDTSPSADEVARRVYQLYDARGGESGADVDDWLQAEQELRAVSARGAAETA